MDDILVSRSAKLALLIIIFYGSYAGTVELILGDYLLRIEVDNPCLTCKTTYHQFFPFVQKF